MKSAGFGNQLITSKILDARRRGAMSEAYEAIGCKASGPEGGAIEDKAADDAWIVDQGSSLGLTSLLAG